MFKELGYYTCEGNIFETKLQAMLYANPKKLPIQWHFNNEKFNSYDWSVEPTLSLDALYNQRARQIREQYDYVILSYSGGSDSNNILESFIRQGLIIDEIITTWALDASSKYLVYDENVKESWNNNAEFHLHTKHRLEYIKNNCPKTKITVLDSSKNIIDALLNNSDANWINGKNDVFNVTGAFQYNLLYFSEIRKRFDKLGRVAYVIGVDKPRIIVKDETVYMYFTDKGSSITPIKESIVEYSNITPVLFYWSPDCCDLLCKQAHTIYKYLKTNSSAKKIWQSKDIKIIRATQEGIMRDVIYSTWNNSWFQVKKAPSDWYCELDYWFTKGWSGTKEHSIWLDGLKNLIPKISNFLQYNTDGTIYGTRFCLSKLHYIGSFGEKI
jgi:hypothetical protein